MPTISAGDSGVHHGQLHIFLGVGTGDEVEVLEDKADFPVADSGQLVVSGLIHFRTVQGIGPLGGAVQYADEVHQRTLAGPGGPHDREELAGQDVQVDAVENLQLIGLTDIEPLIDAPHTDDGVHLHASHHHLGGVGPHAGSGLQGLSQVGPVEGRLADNAHSLL